MALMVGLLFGCKPAAPPPPAAAPPAAPTPVVAEAPVVVPDDYVYYPDYEVYYNPGTHLFWYPQGGAWVSGPVAPGFSADVVLGSPSVRMDFHDSPANHHADVARQYPRGWRPPH